jgi:hypothetical protein
MADIELNVLGWIVFAVFAAVILFMIIGEIISPIMKRRYKDKAYRLLENKNARPSEIRQVIKDLNMHVGRLFKDEEVKILMDKLAGKLIAIEKGHIT